MSEKLKTNKINSVQYVLKSTENIIKIGVNK